MSNETKREVFDEVRYKFRNFKNEHRHGMYASPDSIDHYLSDALKRYAAALPDDLPVIPKEVSDYIRKTTAPGKNGLIEVFCSLADDIRAVGHDNIYKWELWMLNNQAAVARAWVLGVWRVEETGEIVKLEAGK